MTQRIELLTDHPKEGSKGDLVTVSEERARFLSRYGYARPVSDTPPAQSAKKGDWIAWAKAQGATVDELADLTKDQIIETWGGTP